MANENENSKLTVTLTGRPPVKIEKQDWEVLASATENDRHGAQIGNQPNIEETWKLIVRQHDDGRTIVYAIYNYDTCYQAARGLRLRGGELLPAGDDIPAAIKRVADTIEERIPAGGDFEKGVFPRLAEECIADLPALEI